jgi:transposase
MFIRASVQKDKTTKREYKTFRLVESYRNQSQKVRQRTILNLGSNFDFPQEQWKIIADRVEEILSGQETLFKIDKETEKEANRIAKVLTKKHADTSVKNSSRQNKSIETDFQSVDVNSLDHKDVRKVGCEHVAHQAIKQLDFVEILKDENFNDKQINTAIGTIVARLIQPGSELSTHRYLTEHSALDELLGVDFSKLPLKNLYKVSDQLLKCKENIEIALYKREKDLFDLEEIITLYDITNTYFEGGSLANEKAQFGRSKEKRNDCLLVALGMVLDSSGFPKKSSIFPGNISEPKTMEDMLKELKAEDNATIVMDAGFATEDNISWLKSKHYKYIVVSRKRNKVAPDNIDSVIVKNDNSNLVKASLVENTETEELELYCHSTAKQEKTIQMVNKFAERYENELRKLLLGLTKKGCTKKYEKVVEKLGQLKEKYKKIAKYYDVYVTPDKENKFAIEITWKKNGHADSNDFGTYCLRTNRKDLDEVTFWNIYTTLTELESAFRSLKSELGMRPVYHQKTKRVDGHIFISILAYHILHTIRYQLKQHGFNESWKTLRQILQTQCRITSTLKLEDERIVSIRKSNSPDANQAAIYSALGIDNHPGITEKTYA